MPSGFEDQSPHSLDRGINLEYVTGVEPVTLTLATLRSTC